MLIATYSATAFPKSLSQLSRRRSDIHGQPSWFIMEETEVNMICKNTFLLKELLTYGKVCHSVCISVPLWQIQICGLFFTPNPDIRIFLCRSTEAPIYCLAVVSDTGDVGLLMKIKIAVMSVRLRDGVMCFRLQIH